MKDKARKVFLPIYNATNGDKPELAALRYVRGQVLPLVRLFQIRFGLVAFNFLVHDRTSGVPCPPDDKRAYIDLSLWFRKRVDLKAKSHREWLGSWLKFIQPRPPSGGMAGVSALSDQRAWTLLNEQSAWYLRLVESFGYAANDATVLQHVSQFLHFFANMSQMEVR